MPLNKNGAKKNGEKEMKMLKHTKLHWGCYTKKYIMI